MADYDVIVIGAGHNGLVCASYLAQAGERVLVVERFGRPGGCVATEEIAGFPEVQADIGGLEQGVIAQSPVLQELRLADFGLRYLQHDHTFTFPFADGTSWIIHNDRERVRKSIEAISPGDAVAWEHFGEFSSSVLQILSAVSDGPPPDFSDLASLMRLGGRSARVLMQTFLSSPRQVVDTWFESEQIRAGLLNYSAHAQTPPWRLGSGYAPCLALGGQGGKRPEGGGKALVNALVGCLQRYGGAVRCGDPVKQILVTNQRAVGVELVGGERFTAGRAVISAIDARRVFTQLVEPSHLPPAFLRRMERLTSARDNIGEISMAAVLSDLPTLAVAGAGPDAFTSSFSQSGSVEDIEDMFLDIRRGELPRKPAVMWAIPSVLDPTLAPSGKHVMWLAAFLPFAFRDGRTWDQMKEPAIDHLLATIAEVAPDLREKMLSRTILSPLDWERRTGNLNGSADHLDTSIDQMLGNRPSPDLARYRTPIRALYLTGSGTHPGGGITGGPGRNAAREVLRDLGLLERPGLRSLPKRAGHLRDLASAMLALRRYA